MYGIKKYMPLSKRIFIIMCALVLVFTVTVRPLVVRANPIAVALGGIEIGALAFWGGAALVASGAAIIGADPATSAAIRDFGKSAWTNANDLVKQSISTSVSAMAEGWDTTKRYSVEFSADVTNYLKAQWQSYFGKGYVLDDTGKIIKVASISGTILPSRVWVNPVFLGGVRRDIGTLAGDYVTQIYVEANGLATVAFYYAGSLAAYRNMAKANGDTFKNAMEAYAYIAATFGMTKAPSTVDPTFDDYGGKPYTIPTFPDVYPQKLNFPAVGGTLNPDGTVATYKNPTIGRVGAVPGAEVAIGYPAIPGDIASLKDTEAISSEVANPAEPGAGDPPRGDWPDSLKGIVTTRFPFSLPWDLYAMISLLNAEPKAPELNVDTNFGQMPLKMQYKFDWLDPYIPWFRGLIIVGFCIYLIQITRNLLGGAK